MMMKRILVAFMSICGIVHAAELKQSTAVILKAGPFVDSTDFVSLEPSLTIAQADIQISKNGGAFAQTSDASPTTTYDADGFYPIPLTTTDTNALGTIKVQISMSGVLPVWETHTVVTANYWDSKYSTDVRQVDVTQWNGTNVASPDTSGYPVVTIKDGTGSGEIATTSGAIDTVTTHTNEQGTDNALLAASAPTNWSDFSITVTTGRVDVQEIEGTTATSQLVTSTDTALVLNSLDHWMVESVTGTDIADGSVVALLVDSAGTADWDNYDNTTESLKAVRDRGDAAWTTGAGGTPPTILQNTTIATLATQVSFTLTAGSADDDAYNNMLAIVEDQTTGTQKAVGVISNYIGGSKTVTLREDPGIFTMATGDTIDIVAISPDILNVLANIGTAIALDGGAATIGSMLTKMADDNSGADFDAGTDSLQEIRDRGDASWITGGGGASAQVLQSTTIATLASQVSFTLSVGSADDDAYNGCLCIVEDQTTSEQKAVGYVQNYTGSSKTITLYEDPLSDFVMVAGDTVHVVVDGALSILEAIPGNPINDSVWERMAAVDDLLPDIGSSTTNIQSRLPASLVGGLMSSDVTAISTDTTSADNLELQYDTTGITGDTFPATQVQVGNLTAGTAAINKTAESFTKSGAEPETNTYTSTHEEDGVYHIVEDVGNATDAYYQFDVGGNGIPVSVTWHGYAQGQNNSYTIWAYNYGDTAYEQIGTIEAFNGTTAQTVTFSMTTSHVGTGGNIGKVRFRFLSADGSAFATDRLLCSFAVVAQSVGYSRGEIWVDSSGTAGSEIYVNCTADNPCPWANALVVSANLGINSFHIANGNTITLDANSDNHSLFGVIWTLELGGQSIVNADFTGAVVSGTSTGSGAEFHNCNIGTATIAPCTCVQSRFTSASGGGLTVQVAGTYVFDRCSSAVAGNVAPILTFPGSGSTFVNYRDYSGGIQFEAMTASDTATVESKGQFIEGTCTGGAVTLRGNMTISGITNITLTDDARYGVDQLAEVYEHAAVWLDTVNGTAGTQNFENGTMDNPVDSIADALTIAGNVGLTHLYVLPGSSFTLASNVDGYHFMGNRYVVALGGQSVSGTIFEHAQVTGNDDGSNSLPTAYLNCLMNSNTLGAHQMKNCGLGGDITLTQTGMVDWIDCYSRIAGTATPSVDFGAAVANTDFNIRNYSGGIEIKNSGVTGTDNMSLEGNGQLVINANCTGGLIAVRGNFTITDNADGAVTLSDEARYDVAQANRHRLLNTTVAIVISQTELGLTAGPDAVDDGLNYQTIVFQDVSASDETCTRTITDYETLGDEIQTIAITGTPSAGHWHITCDDTGGSPQTTGEIAWDGDNAAVQTELDATFGASLIVASGTFMSDQALTFSGAGFTGIDQDICSVDITALTDATGDSVVETVKGFTRKVTTNEACPFTIVATDKVQVFVNPVSVTGNGIVSADLTVGAVDDIWDEGDTAHMIVDSMGRHTVDAATDAAAIVAKLPSGTISDFEETTDPVELLDTGGSAGTSAEELVDDSWDELLSGHSTSGTSGKELDDLDTSLVSGIDTTVNANNAVLTHGTYGLDQLVRSTTPANTLDISASGAADADVILISRDSAAADALETMLDGTGGNKLSLSQLLIVASGTDSAIDVTGSGSGAGITATGGATGPGTEMLGGATGGHGLHVVGTTGTSNRGIQANGGATFEGNANRPGMEIIVATGSAHGLEIGAGDSGGDAIFFQTGDIDGANFTGSVASVVGAVGSVTADVTTDAASRTASQADVSGLSTQASVDTIDGNVDSILVDTGTTIPGTITTLQATADAIEVDTQDLQTQIGTAGAGLTAINLPNQTMNITGDITGNLSGSVGSVTADVTTDTASRTASKADVSNLDVAVSTRSSHVASDVWDVATRETTGGLIDTTTNCTNCTTVPAATIATAVWAEAKAGAGAGSYGELANNVEADVTLVLADTNQIQGKLPSGNLVDSTDVGTATTTSLNTYDGPTKAEMDAAHALLSTHDAADVWTVATRGLSESVVVVTNNDKTGYSISGTKNTLDDLNDITTTQVKTQADQAIVDADLDDMATEFFSMTELDGGGPAVQYTAASLDQAPAASCASQSSVDDIPTVAEFEARTIVSADYFDPTADTVANVTTVDTVEGVVTANALRTGTAQAGTSSSITLDAGASSQTAFYIGGTVDLTGGTGVGQGGRTITAYDGSTKIATTDPIWLIIPDNTTTFSILGNPRVFLESGQSSLLSNASSTSDAIFEKVDPEVANILADTNELQADDIPGLIAALNDITAASVWAVGTRGLTEGVDITEVNSAAVVIADFRADVSALATTLQLAPLATSAELTAAVAPLSTHDAADVWGEPIDSKKVNITEVNESAVVISDFRATGFSTHDAADVETAIFARVIDGAITFEKYTQAMQAVLYGKTTGTGNNIKFYKQNGTTVLVDIDYTDEGIRSVTIN